MPYSLAKAQILMDRAVWAPRENREKIIEVAKLYKTTKDFSYREARNMVDKLLMPSLVFKSLDSRARVDKLYEDFMSKHSDKTKYPEDALRSLTPAERRKERLDRLKKNRQDFAVRVSLLRHELTPVDDLPLNKLPNFVATEKKASNKKKVKGLVQFWSGTLDVVAPNDIILRESKNQVVVRRGSKWFKHLYPICMTDANFAKREKPMCLATWRRSL